MKKIHIAWMHVRILAVWMTALALSGCAVLSNEPVRVVKDYIRALADQDQVAISNLTCKDWETQAFLELDALQLVKATVSDLNCHPAEAVDGGVIVDCTGTIETTYNNETSSMNLSQNRYFVSHENGDWLVCGYR